tara:strand:+ start:2999 stop:3697 length:699 start_codon:yes stop_codon:yes gene_type:complete
MNTARAKKTNSKPKSTVKTVNTTVTSKESVAKTPSTKKSSKVNEVVKEVVKEELVKEEVKTSEVETSEVEMSTEEKQTDRDTILEGFDALSQMIDTEIQTLRENPQKQKGIKFLRSLNKNIKLLRSQSTKVLKRKTKNQRKNNRNSGFLKPVSISNEMAEFTGWNVDELRSRVEVTKYICDYITQNKLQNPEDRRQIKPDEKLKRLLSLKGDEDLRYYSLQTHLKQHFPKST